VTRWRGAVAATAVLVVAGLSTRTGALVVAAAVPLCYLAAEALSTPPGTEGLVASRTVHPTPAAPERAVTVTLVVRNEADRTLPDVRVVDGVPEDLAVLAGSPRGGDALGPGEELTLQYAVVARRGDHAFSRPKVRVRGLGGGARATTRPATGGDATLVCRLDAGAPPIDEYGDRRVGRLAADAPGPGVVFHSVREHRSDDPADRIDWRHYAKRGELATTNYERRVAATVVLVVDARAPNRVAVAPGHPTAVEVSAYAATHAAADLLARGHDVGVAVLGVDGEGPGGIAWLPPAAGAEQRARALDTLAGVDDGDPTDVDDHATVEGATADGGADDIGPSAVDARSLLATLPPDTQLVVASPLLDDAPLAAVETWRAADVPVTVVSPDVVAENTVSGQQTQLRRRTRLARAQAAGSRAVDWRRGTPLAVVLEAAELAAARTPAARSFAGVGRAGGGGR
jgi:uncharacterized protein (DUF58 family)